MPNVTDAFAETSEDQLKVIVSNISPYSSAKAVVLSEECGGLFVIQLGLFCLSAVLGGYFIPVKDGEGDSLEPLA